MERIELGKIRTKRRAIPVELEVCTCCDLSVQNGVARGARLDTTQTGVSKCIKFIEQDALKRGYNSLGDCSRGKVGKCFLK